MHLSIASLFLATLVAAGEAVETGGATVSSEAGIGATPTCATSNKNPAPVSPEVSKDENEDDGYDPAARNPYEHYPTRNIWGPGDLNRMFQRIVDKFPQYKPEILSSPDTHNGGPWLLRMDDFITDRECEIMIEETKLAINGTRPNMMAHANDEANEDGGVCQSTQCWCSDEVCMKLPEIVQFRKRVENLVNATWKQAELMHFIEYIPDQRYGRHHDWINGEEYTIQGPRLWTLLMYFHDIPEENGGNTCFSDIPDHDGNPICVQPKKGRLVLWPNILDENPNKQEQRTWHEANPIKTGFKHSGTIWFHLREPDRTKENGGNSGADYDYDSIPGRKIPGFADENLSDEEVLNQNFGSMEQQHGDEHIKQS